MSFKIKDALSFLDEPIRFSKEFPSKVQPIAEYSGVVSEELRRNAREIEESPYASKKIRDFVEFVEYSKILEEIYEKVAAILKSSRRFHIWSIDSYIVDCHSPYRFNFKLEEES